MLNVFSCSLAVVDFSFKHMEDRLKIPKKRCIGRELDMRYYRFKWQLVSQGRYGSEDGRRPRPEVQKVIPAAMMSCAGRP